MRRFLPRSLFGQMALLLGLALLVAQLVNFALILNERQKLSLAQSEAPAITRFAAFAADYRSASATDRPLLLVDASRRGARFSLATSAESAGERDQALEAKTREALAVAGVQAGAVEVRRAEGEVDSVRAIGRNRDRQRSGKLLLISVETESGRWLLGRMGIPRAEPFLTARLAAATALLYLIVLGATLLIARRLARPLGDLTRAAEQFGGRGEPVAVQPRGPEDLRRAIVAFNAMNRRVVALLDEKDRMLGAIGHDLRTPLASLRIRAEGVESDEERQRMVATIEEMTVMLEDILVLAQSGRAREESRPMDVTALADTIVEEFRELGHDADMHRSERAVLPVQPNLLRRALRNLIDNAVKYGGSARVAVERDGAVVRIVIRDDGPGLAPEELAKVQEPFYRVEASRNRETGGTGLGLAIARAVAEAHGGSLSLANAPGGGLEAALSLPAG